jgi:hypothetical protein
MMLRNLMLMPLCGVLLAACVSNGLLSAESADAGKTRVAKAIAGADLIAIGQTIRLAEALAKSGGSTDADSPAEILNEAGSAMFQDGQILKTDGRAPEKLAEQIQLALPSMAALVADNTKAGPRRAMQAGRAAGYLDGFRAAVALYNLDAPAAALPKVTLSGG